MLSFTQKQMRATERRWEDQLSAYLDDKIAYVFERANSFRAFTMLALAERALGHRFYSETNMIWQYERRYGFYSPSYYTD